MALYVLASSVLVRLTVNMIRAGPQRRSSFCAVQGHLSCMSHDEMRRAPQPIAWAIEKLLDLLDQEMAMGNVPRHPRTIKLPSHASLETTRNAWMPVSVV